MNPFIEHCTENITSTTAKKICDQLQKEKIQSLCLRECTITDKDLKTILKHVGTSYTIRHLSLCVEVVVDSFRVQTVAQAVQDNLSLSGLFLHGNPIGDNSMKVLQANILRHPGIVTLDLSDCQLGDEGVECICQLLPGDKTRHGLRELVLSSNPDISNVGWNKLSIALASGNHLKTFCIDYNELGDSAAACILTAVAGSNTMETLDMECTGITDTTGKLFVQLLSNNQFKLKDVNLGENDIMPETMEIIRTRLHGNELTLDLTRDTHLDAHSDDDRSLATSEPPLDDTNSLLHSRRNSTAVPSDQIQDRPAENANNIIGAMLTGNENALTLADKIKLSKSAILNQTDELAIEPSTMRSRSMIDIRPKDDTFYDPLTNVKTTGSYTRIEVIEHLENLEEPDKDQDQKFGVVKSYRNLLFPETPSLVSLHSYEQGHGGQEDGDFQPIGKAFNIRPTSAPISKYAGNRLTVQGIGSSPVRTKPTSHAVVSPTVISTQTSNEKLSANSNLRRYSTGNALLLDPGNDRRSSLSSVSVRNMADLDMNEDDLNVEDL